MWSSQTCSQSTAYTQRKLSLVELGGATYIVVAQLYTMYSRLLVYTLTVGASSSAQCLPTSRCVHFCGWLPPSASSSAYQLLWVYTLLVAHQCLLASRPEWLERPACSGYQHAHAPAHLPSWSSWTRFFEVVLVESDICEDVLFSDLRGLTTTHYPLGGGPSLAASSELRARN